MLVVRRKTLYFFLAVNIFLVALALAYIFASIFGFDDMLKAEYKEYIEQEYREPEYADAEYFDTTEIYDQAWQTDEGW